MLGLDVLCLFCSYYFSKRKIIRNTEPVSYTHLDVYKRQVQEQIKFLWGKFKSTIFRRNRTIFKVNLQSLSLIHI